MAGLNVEYINPFLVSATTILKQACNIDAKVGKPYLKDTNFTSDSVIIIIGVTGEMRGQVMIEFSNPVARTVAGHMMMMDQLPTLDEIGQSALSELGNMIMGNTATLLSEKGIGIDITPPTMAIGNVQFASQFTKNLCIPLVFDNNTINFNIAMKGE